MQSKKYTQAQTLKNNPEETIIESKQKTKTNNESQSKVE